MPELPEVETIRKDLCSQILNKYLKNFFMFDENFLRKNKITLDTLKTLKGKRLLSIERKGKYLIFIFQEKALIFHLGLTGALIVNSYSLPENYKNHHILTLEFEGNLLHFFDIRKFGRLYLLDRENLSEFYNQLGKDALEISYEEFSNLLKGRIQKIKALLLNQKLISGLGNIYIDEILFRAGIHPERLSNSLSEKELKSLYHNMINTLKEAISLRGSSVKNYVDGEGKRGSFQERHLVYGKRELPCPRCGIPLEYKKIAQRGTTFCPHCQK